MTAQPAVEEIRYELRDRVAYVTIDRPQVLNALDEVSTEKLEHIWSQVEASDARCVVVTGAGARAFCTGADMSAAGVGRKGVDYWAHTAPDGFGGLSLRQTLDIPVIARVNGYALGGGLEMVLGCDIVVAADNAQFGLTEPRVGRLPLDGGMVLLQRKVPHNLAMGMLLTGRRVKADEAYRIGLVNEVADADQLDAAVQRWVDDILACAPTSLRAIKQLVTHTAHLTALEARDARLPALVACLESPDADEGVKAFQEKRSPVWSGR